MLGILTPICRSLHKSSFYEGVGGIRVKYGGGFWLHATGMRPDRQRLGGGFEPDHARAPGESRPEGGQRQQVSRFHVPLLLPDG